jgi:hypothetical protein
MIVPALFKTSIIMWGPGIAAIVCFRVFNRTHLKTITFLGSSVSQSLLFYFFPFLVHLILSFFPGTAEHKPQMTPLIYAELGLFNIVGQELGWRGYLQDAVRPLPKPFRYILIGILWELWHFTSRTALGSLTDVATRIIIFYPVCILFSWLIGEATDRSKSLFVAFTLHFWFYMLYDEPNIHNIATIALSLPVWLYLLYNWKQSFESTVIIRRGNNSTFTLDERN